MSLIGNLLDGLLSITDLRPRFTGPRCLVERYAVGGCDACSSACPHGAVTIDLEKASVEISDTACTGCGLCVAVCPSGALEYDVEGTLAALKRQGESARLACSKAESDAPTLHCLARLTPSHLMAAAAWNKDVTLERGDCGNCPIGSDLKKEFPEGWNVPDMLEDTLEEAHKYREASGGGVSARVVHILAGEGKKGGGERVSRRGAFASMFSSARTVVADLIPEKPLPFVDWSNPQEHVPSEWQWRFKALKPRPAPDTLTFWPAPVVDDSCILCPVCMNVCPTEAIVREILPDGGFELMLELSACTGCNACVASCPPDAMTLEPYRPFSAFDTPLLLFSSALKEETEAAREVEVGIGEENWEERKIWNGEAANPDVSEPGSDEI